MISVIVPCFNEKNTIEEIVYRIQSQNFIKTQIIIVDDGSTDGTREILRNKIEKKYQKLFIIILTMEKVMLFDVLYRLQIKKLF